MVPTHDSARNSAIGLAEGNRVAKGSISTWSCDTTVNGFVATTAYVLGPHGEQLTEMTNNSGAWQWAHTNVEAGGLSATYDGDLSQKTAGPLYFHLSDWLGTRRQQTDYAGNPLLDFTGLPYGDGLSTIPVSTTDAADATEHHFTGHERDAESGNDYFGARYFSSNMGRFMTPDWSAKEDPVPYAKLDNPQTLNLYAYMDNNPLGGVDPNGHDGNKPTGCSGSNAAICAQIANLMTNGVSAEDAMAYVGGKAQQQSSGGSSFWHGVSNLFHLHSWNYVKTSVTDNETYSIAGAMLPPAANGAAQAAKAAAQGRPTPSAPPTLRPVPGPDPVPPQVPPGEVPEIEPGASLGQRVGVAILNLVKGFGQNVEAIPIVCVTCNMRYDPITHRFNDPNAVY